MPRPERFGRSASLRWLVLLPFALGATLLVFIVVALSSVLTLKGLDEQVDAQSGAVRQTFTDSLAHQNQRLSTDAQLLADNTELAAALARGKGTELAAIVVPFGVQKDFDYVAIYDDSGHGLLVNGHTEWGALPVVGNSVRKARVGIPQRGLGVGQDGRPAFFSAVPVRARNGIVGVVVTGKAIDERVLAEIGRPLGASIAVRAALRIRENVARGSVGALRPEDRVQRYQLPLNAASQGVAHVVIGLSTAPRERAQRRALIFGASTGLLLELALVLLLSLLLRRTVISPLDALRAAMRHVGEHRYDMRLDNTGARELREVAEGFNGMISLVGDQQAKLAALAAKDPLTGLANHRHFHEQLEQEIKRAERGHYPLGLVTLDLDHFKTVNDKHGHPAGDEVLRAVARELTTGGREGDLVARVGGEEFAVLLAGCDHREAATIAERMRESVGSMPGPVAVTCSAGVAVYPADALNSTDLLELADGALYWAKESGRDQVRSHDPKHVNSRFTHRERAQVLDLLAEPEPIQAAFQPIADLARGEVVGYEALARFPTGGTPDEWFARARRSGLTAQLEATALRAALSVPDRPPGTYLSVNLSPTVLASAEVVEALPAALHDIVIEITEHELAAVDVDLTGALEKLRARGARIAIDDAGAGYAGLSQLMRVRPDIIKLDRTLIEAIDHDPARLALAESLLMFAHRTDAAVCAEGIETLPELRTLIDIGVGYGQGYFLARPAAPWNGIREEATRAFGPRAIVSTQAASA